MLLITLKMSIHNITTLSTSVKKYLTLYKFGGIRTPGKFFCQINLSRVFDVILVQNVPESIVKFLTIRCIRKHSQVISKNTIGKMFSTIRTSTVVINDIFEEQEVFENRVSELIVPPVLDF